MSDTSDDSRPGFVRMGFLPVTRFTLMARPPVASLRLYRSASEAWQAGDPADRRW